ncbi:Uncharacterised protein [Escherichia coli]|uniref:Uncharacterized protein n=1 Tax=Escherichia coli TaxID=562 RepID=A0A376P4B1_ECOLX|nr:Uncharacterised protein [Escherichia coli]
MVLMIKEIWLTETPRIAGPHLFHHAHCSGIVEVNARQDQHADLLQVR